MLFLYLKILFSPEGDLTAWIKNHYLSRGKQHLEIMYPGLTTFNHLVNDSLMPGLSVYADERRMRTVTQVLLEAKASGDGHFFDSLPKAMSLSGFTLKQEILADWAILAETGLPDKDYAIGQIAEEQSWPTPFSRFFMTLTGHCAGQYLQWFTTKMHTEKDEHLQQLFVMHSLKYTGQFMVDSIKKPSLPTLIQPVTEGIKVVLAFVWLKIYTDYSGFISFTGLPLLREEVMAILQSEMDEIRPLNLFRQTLSDLLPEDTPSHKERLLAEKIASASEDASLTPHSEKEIIELTQVLQKELTALKDTMLQSANKDRYVRASEACRLLSISRTTLNDWRRKGKITLFRREANRFVYSEVELNKLKRRKSS